MALIELLQSNSLFLIAVTVVLGLLVGSFLNVVIHRLPIMLERQWNEQCHELLDQHSGEPGKPYNLIAPRSCCPQCGHAISALENIPIVSYVALRGRCKACGTPISARYPMVELLTGVLSGLVVWHFGFTMQAAGALVLTWSLISLAAIDLDHKLLPDAITLPILWLGLLINIPETFTTLQDSVIGAVAGYLVLWAVFQGFKLLTGKEGMGYGDFKLLALLGAWLGWQFLPLIVVLSSVVGAAVGIGLVLIRRHERSIPIPFGPYLAAAGWIALIWGADLIDAYLVFSGLQR